MVGAEECYCRAILASPGDGDLLSLYAKLIWETHRDEERAKSYFDQAVSASPDDWYVILSIFAWFLKIYKLHANAGLPGWPDLGSVPVPLHPSSSLDSYFYQKKKKKKKFYFRASLDSVKMLVDLVDDNDIDTLSQITTKSISYRVFL